MSSGSHLLAALARSEQFVVVCGNGVLASIGAVQNCEEGCDKKYCVGLGK